MGVTIVETSLECERAINDFQRHYEAFPVLGFDCEWVSVDRQPKKVALLQLAAINGECVLIRLFKLQAIPDNLKRILANESVLKVGVDSVKDAKKLLDDYRITVRGSLDLRFLAMKYASNPGGLEDLAAKYAGVTLEKDWRISANHWEDHSLPADQVTYAARDAQVAATIFKKLASLLWPNSDWATIFGRCTPSVGREYP